MCRGPEAQEILKSSEAARTPKQKLLASFDLRFTEAVVVDTPCRCGSRSGTLKNQWYLKAQVPFGGRGKAGAVKSAETAEQAHCAASELLGMELRGQKVACISVEPKVTFACEFYVGIAWDTAAKRPVALLSVAGGVEVEASSNPELAKRTFDPWIGLRAHEGREMAAQVGLAGKTLAGVGTVLEKLAQAFLSCDARDGDQSSGKNRGRHVARIGCARGNRR